MFANSLIPSSGATAVQPSARADPPLTPHLPIFNNTAHQSKVDSSVKHLWSANDANIHACFYIWEQQKITRDAKAKELRLTIWSYVRSYALCLEGEDLKCTLSFHLHTPTTFVNASEEGNTAKILNTLKET